MPIYMRIEGVHGTVTQKGYERWIEVISVEYNTLVRGPALPGATSIIISRCSDIATSGLMQNSATGAMKDATIVFIDTDGRAYFKIELDRAVLTMYANAPGRDCPRGFETLELHYANAKYQHLGTPKDSDLRARMVDLVTAIR